jgi:spore coat protein U-like protein
LLVASAAPAVAATSCTFGTVLPLPFGIYDPYSAAPVKVAGGSVQFSCNVKNVPVTLNLDMGLHSLAFGSRRMQWTGGSDYLSYNIYFDSAYTQIFGDGTGGTVQYSGVTGAKGATQSVSYYGMLPAGQDVTAGSYADTVTATLSF